MAKVCPSCELTYSNDEFFCAADGSPLRSTDGGADNLVGTVIADRYRIESILGEGGMGRVYRARHVRVPREAAIKVLRRALIADTYAVAAFNREARNAASVGDHPNVAAVYDFGETSDGLVFLAMEYVDGETLARRLEREPVIPPRRAVEIVRQIAAGLTAAHELAEPVVHRDLKPDNILLKTTRDGTDWVKIVDFGIAKAVKRDTQLLTTPGLVVGTPRYMCPEQLTGGTIDARTDVYALAIIAYRMLTGRMPFASASADDEATIQWALQRLTSEPLPLQQVNPDIEWPVAAQAVFDRALARIADQRTPTAAEFARSLARAFGFATPSGVMGAIPDVTRAAPAAAVPTVRADAPAAQAPAPSRAAPTRAIAPAETGAVVEAGSASGSKGRPRSMLALLGVAAALVVGVGAAFLWSRGPARTGASSAIERVVPNDTARRIADTSRSTVAAATTTPAVRVPLPGVRKESVSPTSVVQPAPASDSVQPTRLVLPGRKSAPGAERSAEDDARARATLDEAKGVAADPYAISAEDAAAILDRVDRLLPTLTSRADSVEASFYAVVLNLRLDKPDVACRLLTRIRPASRGTRYQQSVDRFLADTALACPNSR